MEKLRSAFLCDALRYASREPEAQILLNQPLESSVCHVDGLSSLF